jgi:hypothetical protein
VDVRAMNAVWCVAGMETFGRVISRATGWQLYVDTPVGTCDTVLIVGWYDPPHYDHTLRCTSRAKRRLAYFNGTDALHLTRPDLLPDAAFLCETPAMQSELRDKGIEAHVLMLPTQHHFTANPLPDKPAIAFYGGNQPIKYGSAYIEVLQEAFPAADVYPFAHGQYDAAMMQQLCDNTSVYVRLPEHDGGAALAREFMEGGRRVVCTADLPFATVVSRNQPQRIIRAVRDALNESQPDWEAAAHYHEVNADSIFAQSVEQLCSGGAV